MVDWRLLLFYDIWDSAFLREKQEKAGGVDAQSKWEGVEVPRELAVQ